MRRVARETLRRLKKGERVDNATLIAVIEQQQDDIFFQRRMATKRLNDNHKLRDTIRVMKPKIEDAEGRTRILLAEW